MTNATVLKKQPAQYNEEGCGFSQKLFGNVIETKVVGDIVLHIFRKKNNYFKKNINF